MGATRGVLFKSIDFQGVYLFRKKQAPALTSLLLWGPVLLR